MKVAIYSRVSSAEQDAQNQVAVLEDWARQRGWEVYAVYTEEESAWKTGHQKELAKLLKSAETRRFKAVLVWALDRLSREGSLAILSLINRLGKLDVRVFSYQESWTEAPGDLAEILYAIAGWVARMESKRISERTKAGLARAVREGKVLGRPEGAKDKRKRRRRGRYGFNGFYDTARW